MTKRIERLQGEGARLVWPAKKIDPIAAEILVLREKSETAHVEKRAGRDVILLLKEIRRLQGECAAAFAEVNGWSLAKTPLNPDRFFGPGHLVRHPESFRWRGRSSPAALVVHTYHSSTVLQLVKLAPHLTVDRLPSSYYWVGHTTAFCFRRMEGL